MNIDRNKTYIMGVLNVTPDSFFDGGKYYSHLDAALTHAHTLIEEGADILDIGGESSRPGSDPISIEEELERVLPIVERLRSETNIPLSIDTYKPEVARECLKAGAHILNDISGLRDEEMVKVASDFQIPVVIMHMQGSPKTMQENPTYTNVVEDIKFFFKEKITVARAAGIKEIILDPGIGFGKKLEHNLKILKHLHEFTDLGYPLLLGTSRKSFIGKLTGDLPPSERLEGTIATNVVGFFNGANIFRVHDVKECKRALVVAAAIKNV